MSFYPDEKLCKNLTEQNALAYRAQADNVGIFDVDEITIENSARYPDFFGIKFVAMVGLFVLATVLLMGYLRTLRYS